MLVSSGRTLLFNGFDVAQVCLFLIENKATIANNAWGWWKKTQTLFHGKHGSKINILLNSEKKNGNYIEVTSWFTSTISSGVAIK